MQATKVATDAVCIRISAKSAKEYRYCFSGKRCCVSQPTKSRGFEMRIRATRANCMSDAILARTPEETEMAYDLIEISNAIPITPRTDACRTEYAASRVHEAGWDLSTLVDPRCELRTKPVCSSDQRFHHRILLVVHDPRVGADLRDTFSDAAEG
jgi:hypothetical protein